jgi:hypothetical protein
MTKAAYPYSFEYDYCSKERTHHMKKDTTSSELMSITGRDVLTEILRKGAQQMLAMAVENEVVQYIADHEHMRDSAGRRLVVRNGHLPAKQEIYVHPRPESHTQQEGEATFT